MRSKLICTEDSNNLLRTGQDIVKLLVRKYFKAFYQHGLCYFRSLGRYILPHLAEIYLHHPAVSF